MEFGKLIKELRIAKGLTIKQVATAVEVNTRAYNYYEQSEREPSLETLKKMPTKQKHPHDKCRCFLLVG